MKRQSRIQTITGYGQCVPPQKPHVIIYFLEKGLSEKKAIDFFEQYAKRKWLNNQGNRIKNWKVHAWEWAWENK
ncbi:MAG: hypothetical protein J0G96_06505 [Flavobacteriia bacterium]|nr:hypothetical protein [Flavobacteriia bacterium]OJX36571.1 MAG: hypothetical protein BGO87_12245 [Flavobacteriia bacterium 40-80]